MLLKFRGAGPQGAVYASATSASAAAFALSALIGLSGVSGSASSFAIQASIGASGVSASTATTAPTDEISASGVSASAGQLSLSGGIGLSGVSASTASTASEEILSASGVSVSTGTFTATGPGVLTIAGVSASSNSFGISQTIAPGFLSAPDFTGVHWYIASRNLLLAGLNQTQPPIKVKTNIQPPGIVLSQYPPAGTVVPLGTNFVLTVVTEYLDGATQGIYPWYDPRKLQ